MDGLEQQIQRLINQCEKQLDEYRQFSPGQRRRRQLDSNYPALRGGELWAYSMVLGIIRGNILERPDGGYDLADGGQVVQKEGE